MRNLCEIDSACLVRRRASVTYAYQQFYNRYQHVHVALHVCIQSSQAFLCVKVVAMLKGPAPTLLAAATLNRCTVSSCSVTQPVTIASSPTPLYTVLQGKVSGSH